MGNIFPVFFKLPLDKGNFVTYNVNHKKGNVIAYNINLFAYIVKG